MGFLQTITANTLPCAFLAQHGIFLSEVVRYSKPSTPSLPWSFPADARHSFPLYRALCITPHGTFMPFAVHAPRRRTAQIKTLPCALRRAARHRCHMVIDQADARLTGARHVWPLPCASARQSDHMAQVFAVFAKIHCVSQINHKNHCILQMILLT